VNVPTVRSALLSFLLVVLVFVADGPLLRIAAASKPILSIPQAHNDGPSDRRKSKVRVVSRLNTHRVDIDCIHWVGCLHRKVLRSVTSINFLPNRENLLLSSGSADGSAVSNVPFLPSPTDTTSIRLPIGYSKSGTSDIQRRPAESVRQARRESLDVHSTSRETSPR